MRGASLLHSFAILAALTAAGCAPTVLPDTAPGLAERYAGTSQLFEQWKPRNTISLNVKKAKLKHVFEILGREGKVVVLLPPGVGDERITLQLNEVPWKDAFAQVAKRAGLTARKEGSVITMQLNGAAKAGAPARGGQFMRCAGDCSKISSKLRQTNR